MPSTTHGHGRRTYWLGWLYANTGTVPGRCGRRLPAVTTWTSVLVPVCSGISTAALKRTTTSAESMYGPSARFATDGPFPTTIILAFSGSCGRHVRRVARVTTLHTANQATSSSATREHRYNDVRKMAEVAIVRGNESGCDARAI